MILRSSLHALRDEESPDVSGLFFVYKVLLKMVAAFLQDYESEPNS